MYAYTFIIEGSECLSNEVNTGMKFYVEDETGYDIFKKTKKGKRFIKRVGTFGDLYEKANNKIPHSNFISLNP